MRIAWSKRPWMPGAVPSQPFLQPSIPLHRRCHAAMTAMGNVHYFFFTSGMLDVH